MDMQLVKTGKINPDALNRKMSINICKEFHTQASIQKLDHLLTLLEQRYSIHLNRFISLLEEKYQQSTKKKRCEISQIESFIEKMPKLKSNQKLTVSFFNFHLDLFDAPEKWLDDEFQVLQKNLLRSYLVPQIFQLEILIDLLGRTSAIAFFKEHITRYLRSLPDQESNFIDLPTHFEENKNTPSEEWEMIKGLTPEGKYFLRNNNCLWADALVDFSDKEILYYVCCYGDFQEYNNGTNFLIFTMEHTIAKGDPYCSRMIHDTRKDWHDLKHPSKEFWDLLDELV